MKLTNYNPKLTNQTTNTQTLKTKELIFFVFSVLNSFSLTFSVRAPSSLASSSSCVFLSRSASFSFLWLSASTYTIQGELSQVPFQYLHRTSLNLFHLFFYYNKTTVYHLTLKLTSCISFGFKVQFINFFKTTWFCVICYIYNSRV